MELNPLGAIGLGLMSAGGSLSPEVYQQNANLMYQNQAQDQAKKQFMATLLTKHYENGTIAPEAYQQAMQKLGFQVPQTKPAPDYESLKDIGLGGGGGLTKPTAAQPQPVGPAAQPPDPLTAVSPSEEISAKVRDYASKVHAAGGSPKDQAKAIHDYYQELKTSRESQLKEANIRSEIGARERDKSASENIEVVDSEDNVLLLDKRTGKYRNTGIKARPPNAAETAFTRESKMLTEMEKNGLQNTPEYKRLKAHVAKLDAPSQTMINLAPMPKSDLESSGAQHAAGQPLTQVVPGYGSAVANRREQVRKAAIEQIKKENPDLTDADAGRLLAQKSIDFVAGRRSVTQLQTMLGATRQAISQLEFNINKTKQVLQKIPSTDISPVINAIIRGEEKWTGDPKYSELFYFMSATAMESARILQGGQASIAQLHAGAAEEAKKWANINMTPKSFIEGVAPAMLEEGRFRLKSYQQAIKSQSIGFGGTNSDVKVDEESGAVIKPMTATNPTTGARIESNDGGKTWRPVK